VRDSTSIAKNYCALSVPTSGELTDFTDLMQEDFARSLGISQAQLSKYELGQSALPLRALVKLAQKSGRTTDWILTGRS